MRKCIALLFLFLATVDACMRVTPGEPGMPATPCKNCAANLITISQSGAGGKPMDMDVIVKTGPCAARTFTCNGRMASIGIWGEGDAELGSVTDEAGAGTISLPLTCNAAGTAWQYMGTTVKRVECAAAVRIGCQACDPALTEVLMVSDGAKMMEMDVITNPLPEPRCAVRTFTCTGMSAMIEIFAGNPRMSRGKTNNSPTEAKFEVKCNAAGTGWENAMLPGEQITAVECTTADVVPPVCERCAANLLEVRQDVQFGKEMAMDVTTAACERTFTCMGTAISLFQGNREFLGEVIDTDTGGPGMAVFKVVCNAAGTGWVSPDDDQATIITSVACTEGAAVPCQTCDVNLITLMEAAPNKPMDGVVTVNPDPDTCAVRKFTCMGDNAKIEYFTGAGVSRGNVNTGAMTVEFSAKCNAAGTGWEFANLPGEPITSVACSVGAAPTLCKMCTADQLMVTQLGVGSQPMTSDMTAMDGACFERTLTCMGGMNEAIDMFTGNRVPSGNVPNVVTLTCNAAGTGWEHPLLPGDPITAVECSYS